MKKAILYTLLFLFISSFIYTDITIQSTKNSLFLWITKLVPSFLFPLIFVQLLSPFHLLYPFFKHFNFLFKYIFHVNAQTMEIICNSILLGFPASSLFLEEIAITSSLNKKQYHRFIGTCFMASPTFILLTLSNIIPSHITSLLFIIQITCVFILLFLTRSIPIYIETSYQYPSFYKQFYHSIDKSIHILILILAYLIIVEVCTSIVSLFLPLYMKTPLVILSEFSSGVFHLFELHIPYPYIFTTLVLSYGGFCVHLQILSLLNPKHFSYQIFLKYRILHILISLLIAIFIFR